MNHLPREIHNVAQMQILQICLDKVHILVTPTSNFGDSDWDAIVRNARQRIPSDMEVMVYTTDLLYRVSSGKLPLVIRHF